MKYMNRSIKSKLRKKDYSRIPQKPLLPLLLFIVLLFVVFAFMKIPSRDNLITQNMSAEPILNLGNMFEKGHKIAYLKGSTDLMSVWIYDLDTETEREVVPPINPSVFCGEGGCLDRSFSFSPGGTKLAVDLLLNGEEKGFGIVDITQKRPKAVYVNKGFRPLFSSNEKGIFYYDKNYDSPTLYYKNLVDNTQQKIGPYSIVGWLSENEVVMNYQDVNQDQVGVFVVLDTVTFNKKLITVEQLYNQQKITRGLAVSPKKDKIMIAFSDKPAQPAVGIANLEGTLLSLLKTPIPPLENPGPAPNYGDLIDASWSPDGRYIATQIRSPYLDLPSNINIYDIEKNKLIRQIPMRQFLIGGGCWVSSPRGETLVSLVSVVDIPEQNRNTRHKVRLYNLKTNEEKIIDLSDSTIGYSVACH